MVPPMSPERQRDAPPAGSAGSLARFGATTLTCWGWGLVRNVLVLCSDGDVAPAEPELSAWIARLAVGDFDRLLVHSCGAPMSAKHRARISDFWRESGRVVPPCALITDRVTQRTIATAFMWMSRNSGMRAFASRELAEALHWLATDAPLADVDALITGLHAALVAKQQRSKSQIRPKVEIDDPR